MQTPIERLWEELGHNTERPVFRRVDENHPLDLYAGITGKDTRLLMLVSTEEPPAPPTYDTITVTKRHRADGHWTLLIELENDELATPFARLCQDLIETSRNTKGSGPSILIQRLARWRQLLNLASKSLSEQALRGLLGELIMLRDEIAPRYGATASVNAWVGPSGAPQDFVIAGIAIEVKTITPTATTVTISSLEQLDTSNPLLLTTVLLSPSNQQQPGAFTPPTLVQAIRDDIGDTLSAEFDQRLAEAGYEDRPEYATAWYQTTGKRHYRVTPTFPRLTTTNVPPGITAATYDIALATCASFTIPEQAPWN